MPTPTLPLKLTNPHKETCGEDNDTLVQARLSTEVFNYFFRRGVFTGDRGPRQALICTFFQKFYEQCQSDGIVPAWDPDNESRVAAILARLNFNEPTRDNLPDVKPERPVRSGRANPRASKSPRQSAHRKRDGRPASGVSAEAPNHGDERTDVSGQTQQ